MPKKRGALRLIKTLPITEARANLTTLVNRAKKRLDEYIITVNGRAAVVIMSADEYEGWKETNEILADKKLMKDIKQSEKEIAEGKWKDWEDVRKELGWK
ncbi:MAG: type II toxin-antitoxin system Phd/YefM family antitoxin [Candidatus Daviesbacteria bacterium]|nr:type II toxin-antitoxin system Phd/YefM family antitoxin [Candidatus Daviesbacteria bacterium]